MSKITDFYNSHVGKVWDKWGKEWNISTSQIDGAYAGQCVSLVKTYLYYLFGNDVNGSYGDARSYWDDRYNNGILNLCDIVSSPQDGDIVVTTAYPPTTSGHIYIYYHGQAFCQNYAGNPHAELEPIAYQGTTLGILRPKVNTSSTLTLYHEHEFATVNPGLTINVRRDSVNGPVAYSVSGGTVLEYTEYAITNGHRYISWVSNGVRYFMATAPTEERKDFWVTFSKANPNQPSHPSTPVWDQNATLKVGDTVKSVSCAIAEWKSTGSAIATDNGVDCVNIPALGGLVPLSDVSEASDTGDGKDDNYLANGKSRVFLNPCTVQAIDGKNNLIKVNGYWVNGAPLMKKTR